MPPNSGTLFHSVAIQFLKECASWCQCEDTERGECHNRLPQPRRESSGLPTLWRKLSADRVRGCRPANDPPLTEGMLIVGGGGEPQSNKCNRLSPCLTHWFGIKHLCALCWCWYHCGLQLFITTQPRKLWISRSRLDSLRFSKTDYCRGPRSAPCTLCFSNLWTAPPMTTSLKHPDGSISLPSYGDTLFNSEK